jgi:inward rectifier potassium channel
MDASPDTPPHASPANDIPANDIPHNDVPKDLGFGKVVAERSHKRLLNPDGSFNVKRHGLGLVNQLNPFHALMVMPWWTFMLLVIAVYMTLNVLFAGAYWLCGEGAILGLSEDIPRFLQAFFLSVQTFASIGYGYLVPNGIAANSIATLEALVGLFAVALATGVIYARFSRPTSRVAFSHHAVIAPYQDGWALMFRIVNLRKSQLINLSATVILSRLEQEETRVVRRFYPLELERPGGTFFPLSWTVVHPINNQSPLASQDQAAFIAADSEVLILLEGVDETSFTTIHTRSSYKCREVVWRARFMNMFNPENTHHVLSIDVRKLSDIEQLEPPSPAR